MDDRVKSILRRLRNSPEFSEQADFSDVNVCGVDGDNALHWAVRSGDRSTAKALIDAGINVNKEGDLGYTPLHVACLRGDHEMVSLLIENGANLFARSQGDTPFTSARSAGARPHLRSVESSDETGSVGRSHVWIRERISQLQREIAELEVRIKRES